MRTGTKIRRKPPPPATSWRSAWRGVSLTAVRNLPGNGLFFFLHEWLDANVREKISGDGGVMSPALARMLCGGTPAQLLEAHAAAARLLGLRGPSTRARHEVLHAEERAVEAAL